MHRDLIHRVGVACQAAAVLWCCAAQAQSLVHFDLPAQPLARSLTAIGTATHTDIGFSADRVAGLIAPSLKADLTVDGALKRVLAGTGLKPKHLDDHTIVIGGVDATMLNSDQGSADSRDKSAMSRPEAPRHSANEPIEGPDLRLAQIASSPQESEEPRTTEVYQKPPLDEIVVTGTHIHGMEPVMPVIAITHEDMVNQGYVAFEQVVEQLPQNFKAGASQESNPVNQIGNSSSNNYGYASGVNLRGLGANATLVLLNGRRLAPTAFGSVTDISQIPVSIIDRVEMLTDGASALYGSDAVAGVVNIITTHDYSGFEVGGRVNSISEGKAPNYGGNVLGGFSWPSGGLVLDLDHETDNPLFARNRSVTNTLRDPTSLLPSREISTYYASLQNQFSDRLNLSGDVLLSRRTYSSLNRLSFETSGAPYDGYGTTAQDSASLQLDYIISSQWTASMVAQGSREADSSSSFYPDPGGYMVRDFPLTYRVFSLEPRADGRLFDAPGGTARLALGGQFRRETYYDNYATSSSLTAPLVTQALTNESRRVASAYGELLVPLVGNENAMPFVQRLRIDIAGRFDDYSRFGRTANPKIGAEWVPLTGLSLHASYSRSYQVPTLLETTSSNYLNYGYTGMVPDPKSPVGSSLLLILDGTNPNLKPETAKNFKVGMTYIPAGLGNLTLDASFFHIDFENQINELSTVGFGTNALQEEAILGSFVVRNPSLAEAVQALSSPGRTIYNGPAGFCQVGTSGCPAVDPTTVAAIAYLGYENSASVRLSGLDFAAKYRGPSTRIGNFRSDFDGTYFTMYRQRITASASEASSLNTLYNPLRFRFKANLGWEKGGWGANLRVNYANRYENTNAVNPDCPNGNGCQIASWTTLDGGFSYTAPMDGGSLLNGVRMALTVTNLFGRAPPLVSSPAGSGKYPYDPTNANPFLRMFGISVTKRWGGGARR
ncbi:MAG: TonB-dependent receptor [Pseudomonadota bacterium]|nr:TonB-dependent receptor [Pseudomonadota bacterium]